MDQHNTPQTASEEPRRYTLRIEVEVRDQDDFQHFQPDTVTARAPQLGIEWVSGNDTAALHDFFHFFVNWSHVGVNNKEGRQEIVRHALQPEQGEVERLREALASMTEVAAEHQRREWESKAQNAAMREILRRIRIEAEAGADHNDEMGDSFSAFVSIKFSAILQYVSEALLAESEGSTDA